MAVTISGGDINRAGAFRSVEALSNSTATTLRTVSVGNPITTIAGGTATGFGVNRYLVSTASAVEGAEKTVLMLATGEAYLIFTGTATGALVMSAANAYAQLKYMNGTWFSWHAVGPTIATATGTA